MRTLASAALCVPRSVGRVSARAHVLLLAIIRPCWSALPWRLAVALILDGSALTGAVASVPARLVHVLPACSRGRLLTLR